MPWHLTQLISLELARSHGVDMSNMLVGSDAASWTTLLLSRSSADLSRLARDRGRSLLKLLCSDLPNPFIRTTPVSLTLESSSREMMGKVEGGEEGSVWREEGRGASALSVRQSSHTPSPTARQQSSAHTPLSMRAAVSKRFKPFLTAVWKHFRPFRSVSCHRLDSCASQTLSVISCSRTYQLFTELLTDIFNNFASNSEVCYKKIKGSNPTHPFLAK